LTTGVGVDLLNTAGVVSFKETKDKKAFPEAATHEPLLRSHWYPEGQQCRPSAQQEAFSKGQQPTPLGVKQQVVVPGQVEPSLHTVENTEPMIERSAIANKIFAIFFYYFIGNIFIQEYDKNTINNF